MSHLDSGAHAIFIYLCFNYYFKPNCAVVAHSLRGVSILTKLTYWAELKVRSMQNVVFCTHAMAFVLEKLCALRAHLQTPI